MPHVAKCAKRRFISSPVQAVDFYVAGVPVMANAVIETGMQRVGPGVLRHS
jgi:hypothetical protein